MKILNAIGFSALLDQNMVTMEFYVRDLFPGKVRGLARRSTRQRGHRATSSRLRLHFHGVNPPSGGACESDQSRCETTTRNFPVRVN